MREEIEGRPLVLAATGLILGLIAFDHLFAIALLLLAVWFFRPLTCRITLAVGFLCGLVLAPTAVHPLVESQPIHGVGTIVSVPRVFPDRQVFETRVGSRQFEVTTAPRPSVMLMDTVSVDGVARPFASPRQVLGVANGLVGTVQLDHPRIIGHGPFLFGLADLWRRSFSDFVSRSLPPDQAGLLDAICFGSRSMMDPLVTNDLRESGLIHLTVASGMQALLLVQLLMLILRFLPISRGYQVGVAGLLLLLYVIASGLNPAIIRASFMGILALSAYGLRRDYDSLSAVALSAILCLMWRPQWLTQPGFQLTFIVVVYLSMFYARGRDRTGDVKSDIIRFTYDYLQINILILLAAVPLVAYYFGQLPILSVVSNLLVGWSLPLIFLGGMMAFILSFLSVDIGTTIVQVCVRPFIAWVETVATSFNLTGSSVSVPSFSGYWVVGYFALWCLTYRRRYVKP